MKLVPFDGDLDEAPAGLVPFDGELDEDDSWMDKVKGGVEAGLSMVAGIPSQIAGGLIGGSTALVHGVDEGRRVQQAIEESNFGLGAYKPSTKKGQEYSEAIGEAVNKPVEWAGDAGGFIGKQFGQEAMGRYLAELPVGMAMEMIEPGAIYGGARAIARRGSKPSSSPKVDAIRSEQGGLEVDITYPDGQTEVGRAYKPNDGLDGQGNLFEPEVEGRGLSPYEATSGDWRVDENGMPIRVDLSLELQNLQQPLQRNLWGDELDTQSFGRDPNAPLPMDRDIMGYPKMSENVVNRTDPEAAIPLTEAIDSMPWAQRRGALKRTQLGREMEADGQLEAAKLQAEIAAVSGDTFKKGFNEAMDKQRGVLRIGEKPVEVVATPTGFEARVDGKVVGYLNSNLTPEQSAMLGENANVDIVKVDEELRGKGVGKALYDAWAKAQEGRITPSGKTSQAAWNVWKRDYPTKVDAFVNQEAKRIREGAPTQQVLSNITDPAIRNRVATEASKPISVLKSQKGGVYFGKDEVKLENSLATSEDGSFIPENPNVEKVIEKALTEKDSKIWTYTQSGATSAAMKSGSSIIKAVSEIVQNAAKRADLLIRQTIFPAEKALQKLSRKEITELGELMKDEMFKGKRYDGEVLAKHLSVKQLEAYANMRELFDKALDTQNAARLSQGKEPISPNEAYMASRWQGDFRQPVYDKNGKLVWYLAAHTKAGLNTQIKELNKIKPGLVIDPAKGHTVRSSSKTDLQSAYTTLLDLLGRDDPAVAQIKQIIEEQTLSEGAMALAQEKHFEEKYNIRGFVGDRPGKGGTKEALAMFAQQIQYAKNAYKWSELQKAAEDVAAIVKNPELQQAQPNNIKYVREYFKNAIGMNEAKVVNALNDTIREGLGFSPTLINNAVGNMKSFFITQKLIISMGYMASNVLQASQVLPYLTDLEVNQKINGNPYTAISVGLLASLPMTISHYMGGAGMSYVDSLPNQFLKDAFRYAEDNGVTARSVYDEAPVEGSFNPVMNYVINPAQRATNFAETLVRSTAFMTFAQFLKSSGKYTDQSKLFQKAEELTNMSMVDYRESERPMAFSKMGAAGNLANTLQTFPVSFYNQYGYMLKQAMKGGVAGALPLATMLAVHYGMAGMMGVPGFDDADKLYKWLRDNALPDSAWNEVSKSPFFSDPKMWIIDNWGQGAMYGALSDKTGIGMTSRVAAPGGGAMIQAPLGPVADIAGQVKALGSAIADPTNTTKWAQSAMKSAPVGLQGLLETAPFMKDVTYVERPDGTKVFMRSSDIADRKGGYARTPEETAVRKFGVRSQKEVLTRDVAYSTALANQTLNKKTGEIVDKYYDAIRRGDTKKVKQLATLYTDISGKEITDQALENQIKEEFYTDIEKQSTRKGTPRQIMNAAKMQKLLESK